MIHFILSGIHWKNQFKLLSQVIPHMYLEHNNKETNEVVHVKNFAINESNSLDTTVKM